MLAGWLDVLDMSVSVPGSEAFEVRQSMKFTQPLNFNSMNQFTDQNNNTVIESLDDFGDLDDILGSIDTMQFEIDSLL